MDQYSREFIAEKARLRLDRFYRATRELGRVLQDRVHPRLPEPAGASHADPTRAPQGRTATRPRPVRPLRPTGPTGSARLRTPNRRGELPASHPRSYHPLADSGDRSCFERGGLGCGRSQHSSYCPISARSGGTTSSSTASTSSTAVSCEAKGLAYKFARFWALPSVVSLSCLGNMGE